MSSVCRAPPCFGKLPYKAKGLCTVLQGSCTCFLGMSETFIGFLKGLEIWGFQLTLAPLIFKTFQIKNRERWTYKSTVDLKSQQEYTRAYAAQPSTPKLVGVDTLNIPKP